VAGFLNVTTGLKLAGLFYIIYYSLLAIKHGQVGS